MFELAKSTLAKALGPAGPSLPFSIGDPLPNQDYDSIWRLHRGTKKVGVFYLLPCDDRHAHGNKNYYLQDDGTPMTVFIFDMNQKSDKRELARNALKRARTIRHPNFLKFIEGVEVCES